MVVHGVAGYVAGCRCQDCVSVQRERERQIAEAERRRWAGSGWQVSPAAAERREAQSMARLERERRRQEREQTLAARKEQARAEREQRRLQQQQETIEHQRRQIAREAKRQRDYQQALSGGDYAWLLAYQRQATQQVRNQMAAVRRQADPGALAELRWRQAQEIHQITEKHHAELVARAQDSWDPDK
ncbi:hypothetical protein ABQE45_24065 [Mycobacteroides chelonae]